MVKQYCNNKENHKVYEPQLTDTELDTINEPQAKIIYENAINVLKSCSDAMHIITTKAESLFKITFGIQSALVALYLFRYDKIETRLTTHEILITLIFLSIPIIIYALIFISPKYLKGLYNPPELTLRQRALYGITAFYLSESIDIQRHAIPFNAKEMNKKAFWLKIMVILTILVIPLLIFFLLWN